MIPLALLLTLLSAGLHATWNVLLKTAGDPLRTSARALLAGVCVSTPLAALAWLIAGHPGMSAQGWLLSALSGLVETVYFIFLSTAYRRGELSVVYPLARGTAPLLAVLIGLVVLKERLALPELAGVGCLLAAIWAVRRPAGGGAATRPALLTGVAIATYSAIDRVGVQNGPPWLYGWALWTWTALLLALWLRLAPRLRAIALYRAWDNGSDLAAGSVDQLSASWQRATTVGVLIMLAYLLVLLALHLAPLSVVAPLRESAVVLVTGWSIWRLDERGGLWLRLGGAIGIVAGIALLAL